MIDRDAEREPRPEELPAAPSRLLQHVLAHGRTATAFRVVGSDLSAWISPHHDGVVAYARLRRAWVAAGEPVSPLDVVVPVAEEFVALARAHGARPSFFATEGRLAASPVLQRLLIGEQPVWNPQHWADHVASHRSLREQLRRARAKGVAIVADTPSADGPDARAVHELLSRWRASRSMAAMHFLVTVDLTSGGSARRQLAAWQHGTLVGLLSMVPVPERQGWLFEHLLRDPDAPNGTLELLVDHAMRTIATEGATWATLGLAPLHGAVHPWFERLRRWSTPLFNFEGLAAFKRKLRPDAWEPIYLAWPTREPAWRAVRDGLRAFAGGSLVRFGVRTVLRGPSPLLLMLEWSLVPWTLALALMPTASWFPSRAAQAAWVAFDSVLLLALRHVRRRSRAHGVRARRQTAARATAVAVAVTIDVVLTLWQALHWNVPRLTARSASAAEWGILLVACAAPAIATPVLWGTARRLRALVRGNEPTH